MKILVKTQFCEGDQVPVTRGQLGAYHEGLSKVKTGVRVQKRVLIFSNNEISRTWTLRSFSARVQQRRQTQPAEVWGKRKEAGKWDSSSSSSFSCWTSSFWHPPSCHCSAGEATNSVWGGNKGVEAVKVTKNSKKATAGLNSVAINHHHHHNSSLS